MSKNPKISIICPSRNLGRFLQDTLDSIFRQDFGDFELIVMDGASTDETLDVLHRNSRCDPRLKYYSEPDAGYLDALWKGIRLARGDYFLQMAVSDGFVSSAWLRRCCETLDAMSDVSLVWGLPQRMTEDGKLTVISYPQFHTADPPQKDGFFYYWIRTGFFLPEGNFCVRRNVFQAMMPTKIEVGATCYLLANYNFFSRGYQPFFVREVANFGRLHGGQLGQQDGHTGFKRAALNYYNFLRRNYRDQLIAGDKPHVFRDGRGEPTHEARLPGRRLPALLRSGLRAPFTPMMVARATLVFEQFRHRIKHLFRGN